jgi:ribosomal protein L22
MTNPTLDEQLAEIEATEAGRTAKATKTTTTEPDNIAAVMTKVINSACAKAERTHRLSTEPAEIRTYPC